MASELRSKVISIVIILGVLALLFSLPKLFGGNAVSTENCSTANSSGAQCQTNLPAIVPEKTESTWIYIVIILAILIGAAGTILLRMQLGNKKENMFEELKEGIEKINLAASRGDKIEAMNQYRTFGEMFSEYRSFIKEEDYNLLYEEALKSYNRIMQMDSGF